MNNWFRFIIESGVISAIGILITNLLRVRRQKRFAICPCGKLHEENEIGFICTNCQFKVEDYENIRKNFPTQI